MTNELIVCPKCGSVYRLHYVDKVKIRKGVPVKFECQHCGMVPIVYIKSESKNEQP